MLNNQKPETSATRQGGSDSDVGGRNQKYKKPFLWLLVTGYWFLFFFTLIPSAHANLLGNPSFEEAIGPSSGNWDSTNGATRLSQAQVIADTDFSVPLPHGGFVLQITSGATDQYTFQTHDSVKAGDYVTFSGRAESDNILDNAGAEMCIQFKRIVGSGDALISQTCTSPICAVAGATCQAANPGTSNYPRFTVNATAPEGTERVVFVMDFLQLTPNGRLAAFDDMSAEVNPAKLSAAISKSHAKRGEILTVAAKFNNPTGATFANSEFQSGIPKGFDLIEESVRLNGNKVQFRQGSLIIPLGTIAANSQTSMVYQVAVTSGVSLGKSYEFPIVIKNNNNLSETIVVRVIIEADPMFDEGTIVGKVFNDTNKNGVQDQGEKGVPFVKLYTEEGISIITDKHGRYHIPAVKPGRHVIKVDAHSLPEGTQFITEESFLVKTTPGLMNKASFAVFIPPTAMAAEFKEDLMVSVTQGLDTSMPVLGVEMEPQVLRLGVGLLEKEAVFRFRMNYSDFVKNWFLEIRDARGEEVWSGFGVGAPPKEVVWSGQTESGLLVKEGLYSYQFKVEDQEGRQDWSPLYFLKVISKTSPQYHENQPVSIPPVGDFNIFKDGKQSIPLVAKPTLRIQGYTRPKNEVTINNYGVPVDPNTGEFQTEIYTSAGEKEIHVVSTTPDGESTSYRKKVNVKDSMFFMVGLGEEQLGVNFQDGDLETAGKEDELKKEFYEDGRLSYYLKGKIKGRVLIKSHYDTNNKSNALFTHLDPDDYYPVYGDASQIDYEGENSLDRFYLLLEMDRSFAKWGSFKTAFNDTETASYNRTLSGLKAHYETLGSTAYGDPNRAVTVFRADARHRGAHDEFAATGGSLYYLSHRNLVEGSEKIRVIVRDKIQNMELASRDLVEGTDYEIDYDEGRILLTTPLDSYAPSDLVVNHDIAGGNPKFLVVDYEHLPSLNAIEHTNQGIRGYTHMGQHIRIGGTAIEEHRGDGDYDLRGVDMTMKFGRNTKITGEYATSIKQAVDQFVSYNGGLTFASLAPLRGQNTRPRENAYLVKAESKPVEDLEISGYVQAAEPGFSNDHMRSQEGTKKFGLAAKYDLTDYLYTRYRYDHAETVGQLLPLSEHNVFAPYDNLVTHVAQIGYDDHQWLVEAEYLRQMDDLSYTNLVPTIQSEAPFENAISGKLGYRLNDKLLPYIKVQTTIQDKANHQFGGGFKYQVMNGVYAYLEQMVGSIGDSTLFGFEKEHEAGVKSYANLKMWDLGPGTQSLSTTLGNSFALSPKSRIYSERQHSSYQTTNGYAQTYGMDHKLTEKWNVEGKFERRHLKNPSFRSLDVYADRSLRRTNTFNTASTGLSYNDHKNLKAKFFIEGRRDQDVPKLWQWVFRNFVDYKVSESTSLLFKVDYGKSRLTDPSDDPADFLELNTGFAYRPVEQDRLQILGRYAYLRDMGNDFQYETLGTLDSGERAHILAMDISYDLNSHLTVVEKIAYKTALYDTSVTQEAIINNLLWAHRFNYHVTKKWDLALEYRALWQTDATETLRHGALVEVDRELYDYVRLGVGYNFTDFDDDLRRMNNYDSHGPFVRLTGKF